MGKRVGFDIDGGRVFSGKACVPPLGSLARYPQFYALSNFQASITLVGAKVKCLWRISIGERIIR